MVGYVGIGMGCRLCEYGNGIGFGTGFGTGFGIGMLACSVGSVCSGKIRQHGVKDITKGPLGAKTEVRRTC